MTAKRLTTAAGALAVALALPAAGVAATPHHFHSTFTDSTNLCGIPVIENETVSGVITTGGNGVEVNAYSFDAVDTNPLNGQSVEIHAGVLNKDTFASPTDNGDGTMSIYVKAAGVQQVRSPGGGLLTLGAGQVTGILTVDATTFDFVSFTVVSSGSQSPDADICPAVVAALD